jgi:opacity protein-like surface antigen
MRRGRAIHPDLRGRVRHFRCIVGLAIAALALAPLGAAAQSRQPWSVQASGEWVFPTKDYGDVLQSGTTLGWELQGRYTFGRFSLGAGYQRSTVFKSDEADLTGTLSLGFVEPRYVVAILGERAAPYVAARLGYGALLIRETPRVTENSFTYGAGAGVMIAVTPRVTIDVGGQYFLADFGGSGGTAGYFLARLGVAVGLF